MYGSSGEPHYFAFNPSYLGTSEASHVVGSAIIHTLVAASYLATNVFFGTRAPTVRIPLQPCRKQQDLFAVAKLCLIDQALQPSYNYLVA